MPGWTDVLILSSAGLVAGYMAGLLGLGGGSVFAPVLLFYFRGVDIPPEILSKLTVGTSLFCVLIATTMSGWFHHREGAVAWRPVVVVGAFSALSVFLVTRFITTQPWYDQQVFEVVFSGVLTAVVVRMVWDRGRSGPAGVARSHFTVRRVPLLAGAGSAAGAVSAAAGVGGGIVLVPVYHRFLGLPIHRAVGTSSATIVLITLVGVLGYGFSGWQQPVPATAIGYVDVGRGLMLAIPALAGARLGVWTAHRVATQPLRYLFAAAALAVAAGLLYGALV